MKKAIKRNVKKMLALTLIATMLLPTVGCFQQKPEAIAFPEYEDDREVLIGGWDAPKNTLEDIQIAKDMGLTHMFLDQYHAKRGTPEYEAALRLYEQVGLNVIVQSPNSITAEVIINDNTNYAEFPAVTHINYWDEPEYGNIPRVAEYADEYLAKYGDSDILFYVNLLPNTSTKRFDGHTFAEYVKHYADTVLTKLPEDARWLSCDIYPMEKTGDGSELRPKWLSGIETLALQGKESHAKVHFFLQATEHYNYRAVQEEDIRWQFYVNMAFGVQGFSYFTYADSILTDFEHSCVGRNETGKIHDTYYMAQTVNNEIKKFDHVYLNYEWQGTLPLIGTNNEKGTNANFSGLTASLETLDVATRWESAEDALIGVFKDAQGNDGLIVTNFTDPADGLDNLVRFEFNDVRAARVYRGGVAHDYEVVNNRLDVELDPGEGVFIILVH